MTLSINNILYSIYSVSNVQSDLRLLLIDNRCLLLCIHWTDLVRNMINILFYHM